MLRWLIGIAARLWRWKRVGAGYEVDATSVGGQAPYAVFVRHASRRRERHVVLIDAQLTGASLYLNDGTMQPLRGQVADRIVNIVKEKVNGPH